MYYTEKRFMKDMSLDALMGLPTYIVPAYGRHYETEEQVLEAIRAGKDFQIYSPQINELGPYWSIRDWGHERLYVITTEKVYDVTEKL